MISVLFLGCYINIITSVKKNEYYSLPLCDFSKRYAVFLSLFNPSIHQPASVKAKHLAKPFKLHMMDVHAFLTRIYNEETMRIQVKSILPIFTTYACIYVTKLEQYRYHIHPKDKLI